jgi:hypothetical protein
MRDTALLLAIGLLTLVGLALPCAAVGQRLDGGGNEIYLPDRGRVQIDCTKQCGRFRKECLRICKDEGHLPGDRIPSDDCTKDCERFESDCLDACMRGMSFLTRPPAEGYGR